MIDDADVRNGTVRPIPNLAPSYEYVAICHGYYERCRELNRRGVN